jgi:pimeloyl-ACP methyl ester carboxylesterase
MTTTTPDQVTTFEADQIARANTSGKQPVVFVHGLWLLANSWDPWAEAFEAAGYVAVTPQWPGDPDTVADGKVYSEKFAGKSVGQIADHLQVVIEQLDRKPILVGHSFGGLLVQILAGRGLAMATVAISPAPFKGVLPLPLDALRSSSAVLKNPYNARRAVMLTRDQFQFAFGNMIGETESADLYEKYHVPGAGRPLFQAATANLNPFSSETKVDTRTADRGPLLIVGSASDHTAPEAMARAAFAKQRKNTHHVTEYADLPGRGHSLVIDSNWRDVVDLALEFSSRTAPALS